MIDLIHKLALFGPPGIGKSTLIEQLRTSGFSAYDAENDYPNTGVQLSNAMKHRVVGAAQLQPDDLQDRGFATCLLILPEDEYRSRVDERNRQYPEKANQDEHQMAKWRKLFPWDYIVTADSEAFHKISKMLNWPLINS
jgi:GTPase SAR1 family protein